MAILEKFGTIYLDGIPVPARHSPNQVRFQQPA